MLSALRDFLKLEASSGLMLVAMAIVAMLVANSPLSPLYDKFIDLPVAIRFGAFEIAKPLLLWINDGLMAVFFFLVGLELKREVLEGELSDPRQVALPALAAVGGMAVPALIYAAVNWNNPAGLQGWAIPAATDIAFALAILGLLGSRVPMALRVFLVTIAIFDDLGAIVAIALFYSGDLSLTALGAALACLPLLFLLNWRGVTEWAPYLLIGLVMWAAVLKSGVHATLAGVVLAMFIPMRERGERSRSPLKDLEHDLHTVVAYFILPLFAFANAGIPLLGLSIDSVLHPVPLGVLAGLFLGKQIGVLGFTWVGVRAGLARLPDDMTWMQVYGVALLCGVGFTMSLFISSLAFESSGVNQMFDERLGIIIGSLVSGLAGYLVLRFTLPARTASPQNGG